MSSNGSEKKSVASAEDLGKCRKQKCQHLLNDGAPVNLLFEEYQPGLTANHKGNAGWQFGPSIKKGKMLPIPLSAKSGAALKGLSEKLMIFESSDDAQKVVSFLATCMSHYNCRLVVIADSGDDFRKKMEMYINDEAHEDIFENTPPAHVDEKNICFVFPGQSRVSFDMGRSLYHDEPVFRKAVDDCDAIYESLSGKSFCHTYNLFVPLGPGKKYNPDVVDEIPVCQAAILFMQIGLYELMIHWGIKPDALLGQSLGDVAASYASGALNLEEAVTVLYNRAEQQVKLDGTGSMAALRVSIRQGIKICKKYEDLYVACNNGHELICLGGSKTSIKQVCADNPGRTKDLQMKCAFHTQHMDPLKKDFLRSLKGKMQNGKPTTPWYSTVTGLRYEGPADAQYFWNNIRGRVEFFDAVCSVMRDFPNVLFLELASHFSVLSSIRDIAKGEEYTPLASVSCGHRNIDNRVSTLRALATLHCMAIPMDWGNILKSYGP